MYVCIYTGGNANGSLNDQGTDDGADGKDVETRSFHVEPPATKAMLVDDGDVHGMG